MLLRMMSEKIKEFIYLIRTLGLKHLLRIKSVHNLALKYCRGYMVSQCLNTLFEIGFFDYFKKEKYLDVDKYAELKYLNKEKLRFICEYLYSVKIFGKNKNLYFLTDEGRILVEDAKGFFYFLYAYAPIFENLPAIIRNKKTYNKDVFRRAKFVGLASSETERWLPFIIAKEIIRRYGAASVLDLGCGDCSFLFSLYRENNNIKCFGIDSSEEVINHAKEKISKEGLFGSFTLLVGDIFKIDKIPENFREVDIITCLFILHEYFSQKEKLINLLKEIKSCCNYNYILVCELCRQEAEYMRKNKTAISEHHLFHNLSDQSLASFQEWCMIFIEAGFDIIEKHFFAIASQGFFVIK